MYCLYISVRCFCGDTIMLYAARTMWGLTNRPNPVILEGWYRLMSRQICFYAILSIKPAGGSGDPRTNTDHCPAIPHPLFFWSCYLQIKDQRHSARDKIQLTWNKRGRGWRSEQTDSELLWNMMIWNTAPTSDNNVDKVDTGFCFHFWFRMFGFIWVCRPQWHTETVTKGFNIVPSFPILLLQFLPVDEQHCALPSWSGRERGCYMLHSQRFHSAIFGRSRLLFSTKMLW